MVVVCLPRHMEGMGPLQFSDIFTELPVPPQAAGVVETFPFAFIYHSEHYSFLEDTILFLQVFSFFLLGVHFHFFSQVHFACVLCI